jgi:hypothetical protein
MTDPASVQQLDTICHVINSDAKGVSGGCNHGNPAGLVQGHVSVLRNVLAGHVFPDAARVVIALPCQFTMGYF